MKIDEEQNEIELIPSGQKVPHSQMSDEQNKRKKARQEKFEKERTARATQLLELAMDWDRIHVAKELIIKNTLTNILVGCLCV
jgi:hypothetical protein